MLTPEQKAEIRIIAVQIALEIRRELGLKDPNTDMEYLASLPPAERKAILKERSRHA